MVTSVLAFLTYPTWPVRQVRILIAIHDMQTAAPVRSRCHTRSYRKVAAEYKYVMARQNLGWNGTTLAHRRRTIAAANPFTIFTKNWRTKRVIRFITASRTISIRINLAHITADSDLIYHDVSFIADIFGHILDIRTCFGDLRLDLSLQTSEELTSNAVQFICTQYCN